MVLVIETVGTVEGFLSAVKRIDGLEWLGEYEQDDIIPDEDFYNPKDESKQLSGRLFFLFTNQAAMRQLLNLWKTFSENPDKKFSEIFDHGLASIGRLFQQIKVIRPWGVKDRIEETGLLGIWREDLEHDGNRPVRCEVELWFRNSNDKRQAAQEQVGNLIRRLGGQVVGNCTIEDIAYQALLAEVPASVAHKIIQHPDVDLTKCDGVMFFRPVGQMATGKERVQGELSNHDIIEKNLPSGDPIVAVLDGPPFGKSRLAFKPTYYRRPR